MLDVISWFVAVELIGLLVFPLAFLLLPWLPDRGHSLSRPLGLLCIFYPLWLCGSTQVIPNGRITIALLVVILGAGALLALRPQWKEMKAFIGREWKFLLLSEVVYVGVFAVWVYIKAHDPAIEHTEQPMDFAFLTTSALSSYFPPNDPWFSGERVSYYYFGYLIMGGLSTITGIGSSVSYNLAIALIPAMAAAAMFGVSSNMVRLVAGSVRASVLIGFAAVLLLIGISNMESVLEFMRASGMSSGQFWEWVNIKGLDGPFVSSTWYPEEPGWWWWRATRVIDTIREGNSMDYTITEFPFFSFLLGDLHPHVMNIPFVILFCGLVLNFFVSRDRVGLSWAGKNTGFIVLLAVVLGGAAFINLWDLPILAALFGAAAFLKAFWQQRSVVSAAVRSVPVVTIVLLLAFVLYLPFYATFSSSAAGISPVDMIAGNHHLVTRHFHFIVIWGLFLLLVVPFLLWEFKSALSHRLDRVRPILLAVAVPLLPLVVWAFVEVALVEDHSQIPALVWGRFVHLLPLLALAGIPIYVLFARQIDIDKQQAWGFPLLLMSLVFLILIGPELFYVVDLFGNRMNTIFKLYYQAWVLLALGTSFALYYLVTGFARSGPLIRSGAYIWMTVLAIAVGSVLYYPAAATYTKVAGQDGGWTLDGLDYLQQQNPAELQAINWLRRNRKSYDRILEAVGSDYIAETSRVSASTGIPTVLGWPGHEQQWRGQMNSFGVREEAVSVAYQSTNVVEVRDVIERYELTYVYVGPRERSLFGDPPLEGFSEILELVFSSGNVKIYSYQA